MFSGIVEEKGTVQAINRMKNLITMDIEGRRVVRGVKIGDSIAVNGVCLTVVKIRGGVLTFDLMKETLDATTLGFAEPGTEVNLERALKVNSRLGGHFVSGHVDGMGTFKKKVTMENYVEWQIEVDRKILKYIAPKASVAVDGVSLTIGWVKKKINTFSIYLIPHTLEVTTFGNKKVGQKLNIETDMLAKYILHAREVGE
ncbi:MAG TPA: riboflavin synthase [Candidatus Omnitrophota bacterium]|nr:riboflavin synthase [Candidatus Omnitrophota bacterium]